MFNTPPQHQKDVRSGLSYWRMIGPEPQPCPPLGAHVKCEVAVVGGGITGALVACSLSRIGMDVVLVDQGQVGAGSTAASTGLLQYEIDTPLVQLIARIGEPHAVHAYRRGLRAIDELEELVAELPSDCGFARRSTLCLASTERDVHELRRDFECRQNFGFDVHWCDRHGLRELRNIDAPGAIYSSGDGEIDPYQFTQLVLGQARRQGLRAFGETKLSAVSETVPGVELSCGPGPITAGAAVLCTGYFLQPWFPQTATALNTTYAACSEPLELIDGWNDRCLIWETARPYFYVRQTADGRAMIGGEDTPCSDDHDSEELLTVKRQRLQERFEALFPGARFAAACQWAGTFAETKNGLPFIGVAPGQEKIYAALGYGGNGITFSMIAARLLTDLIRRRPTEDAGVFRFRR